MQTLAARRIGVVALLCSLALPTQAQPAGIREACRQFVERDLGSASTADFGEYWAWTVIDNRDGSFSVGARYRSTTRSGDARNRYTTCVLRVRGKHFVLESLAHLIR